MKKSNKILALLSPLAIIPASAVVACSNKDVAKDNPGNQDRVLKENLTRNQILTAITNKYLTSFYANEVSTVSENDKKNDPILVLLNRDASNLFKDAKDIFQFYATSKLKTNPQFFWALKSDYINANIDTSDFNPAPFAIPSDSDFRFMLTNSHLISTNIRLDIQKLLLNRLYLLKNRDEYRKLANNEKGQDKYQLSLSKKMEDKDTSLLQKDIYKSLNFADNSLYLVKYLIDNPILESWSFTDNRDMNLRWGKANISTFAEFNALASYNPSGNPQYDLNPKAKYPTELIATGKAEGNDVLNNLLAYKGIIKNSYTSGILSSSLYGIQNNLAPVYGFVDPANNRVYSQDSFKFAAILAHLINQPNAKVTEALNNKAKEDKLTSFNANDFEFENLTRNNKNTSLFTKSVTLSGSETYNVEYKQQGTISFDGQVLNIPMRLTVKELSLNNYYDFNAKLNYDKANKTFSAQTETIAFNLDKYPTKIDVIKDNQINAQYVVKIAPLYQEAKVLDVEGKEFTRKVLSFANTPWSEESQQKIIANNIIINNLDAIFRDAVAYFKFIGFEFDTTKMNKTVLDILKIEGLI